MYTNRITFPALLSLAVSSVYGYDFGFWGNVGCRSDSLGHVVAGPDQGCMTHYTGDSNSFTIRSTGPVDDPFMVVMFSSSDCNPDTIIGHSDGTDSTCLSAPSGTNYGSFEVWNLMED
ncbi:hypothetical protein DL770_010278 [Monosporascus sp. CRB-9-2]|nr:hypothetical protein DL770_010278 [Monosporascus sp. CRB-9-2]